MRPVRDERERPESVVARERLAETCVGLRYLRAQADSVRAGGWSNRCVEDANRAALLVDAYVPLAALR
jgi:hypothetical protein